MKKVILLGAALALTPLLALANSDTTTTMNSSSGTGVMMPPRTSTGMEAELKGIHMAMVQLSPTDREALVKMIKEYLVSKGIDPAKYAEKRDEIKTVKKQTKEEIKALREKQKAEIKTKREEMKNAIKDKKKDMRSTIRDKKYGTGGTVGSGSVQ